MGDQELADLVSELDAHLEVFTWDGGNELVDSSFIENHEVVDGEILVRFDNGSRYAIKVERI